MTKDQRDLDNLAVAHYVIGGLGVLFACMPLLHVAAGIAVLNGALDQVANQPGAPPPVFGWLFVVMGGMFFLMGQAAAICIIVSGRFLKTQKHYMFSFVVACVMCGFFPFGTVLGVLSIIVLSRDSVKIAYGREPSIPVQPPPNLPPASA